LTGIPTAVVILIGELLAPNSRLGDGAVPVRVLTEGRDRDRGCAGLEAAFWTMVFELDGRRLERDGQDEWLKGESGDEGCERRRAARAGVRHWAPRETLCGPGNRVHRRTGESYRSVGKGSSLMIKKRLTISGEKNNDMPVHRHFLSSFFNE